MADLNVPVTQAVAITETVSCDTSLVTITETVMYGIKKIKFVWESGGGAAGPASGTTEKYYAGEVIRLVTIPGTGSLAPSDNYDVTLLDGDSTDVLMGAGADRDTANTEQVLASSLGCVVGDRLTLHVDNAGASNSGTVIVYIKGQAIGGVI